MAVSLNPAASPGTAEEAVAVVDAVLAALPADELDWVEWKGSLDLSSKAVRGGNSGQAHPGARKPDAGNGGKSCRRPGFHSGRRGARESPWHHGARSGGPVAGHRWNERDGTVYILVGNDDEAWDMGVTIPLGTVDVLLGALGEQPKVTPPPFGPTLF
jgi:hypothetical protein